MKKFHKTALKSWDSTGMVAASSKFLINKVLSAVDFSKDHIIVEFGAGNGCLTEVILDRMTPGSRLYSYELLPEFYDYCVEKFAHDSRLKMLNHNALDFVEDLHSDNLDHCDFIISSLPLSFMKAKDKNELLQKSREMLQPNGLYLQFQYSLLEWPRIRRYFGKVKMDFTLLNLPPAFIYQCAV